MDGFLQYLAERDLKSPNGTSWYLPQTPWITNVNFAAEAYAIDKTTNTQVVYSTVSFIADFTAPFINDFIPQHHTH